MVFLKVLSVSPSGLEQFDELAPAHQRRNELFYIIPFLLAVISLKLGLALFLWRSGYLEYDADGFTRSVRAWEWHTGATKLEVDAWLPLQFWLNGWLMNFWPDLLRLPRTVNMLCSIGTTINLFLIGRSLFGRQNGYATALLAAFFPWEIWFGMSGMSESLTHFFLSLGLVFFCRWLSRAPAVSPVWLVLASGGFLGATMVRYEAWFYSAAYAAAVLYVSWRPHTLSRLKWLQTFLALIPAFSFSLVWMLASWLDPRLHSPLGFARLTSEINARIYGTQNANAQFLDRLVFYPQTFLTLLPPLTFLAIGGSILLLWRPVNTTRPYLALVWGEFALFIVTTLPYNNIAPGSARYPVSNLLLLLPVVAYIFHWVVWQRSAVLRLVAAIVFVGLLALLVTTTLSRSKEFPDGPTRQVAQWLEDRWNEGYLKPAEKILLNIPAADGPRADQFTRAYYALRVLTNHPDNFLVEADSTNFLNAARAEDGTAPHLWVHLREAGGEVDILKFNYLTFKTFDDYTVAQTPVYRSAIPSPSQGAANQKFNFQADEYKPKENTTAWITRPDGSAVSLGNRYADSNGVIVYDYFIPDPAPGRWFITIVGLESGRRAKAGVKILAPGRGSSVVSAIAY